MEEHAKKTRRRWEEGEKKMSREEEWRRKSREQDEEHGRRAGRKSKEEEHDMARCSFKSLLVTFPVENLRFSMKSMHLPWKIIDFHSNRCISIAFG